MKFNRKEDSGLPVYEAVVANENGLSTAELHSPDSKGATVKINSNRRYFSLNHDDLKKKKRAQQKTKFAALFVLLIALGAGIVCLSTMKHSISDLRAKFADSDIFKVQDSNENFGPLPIAGKIKPKQLKDLRKSPFHNQFPTPTDSDSNYKSLVNEACHNSEQMTEFMPWNEDPFGLIKKIQQENKNAKINIEVCRMMQIPIFAEPMRCCHAQINDGKKQAFGVPTIWTCHSDNIMDHLKNTVKSQAEEKGKFPELQEFQNVIEQLFPKASGHVSVVNAGDNQKIEAGKLQLKNGLNYHVNSDQDLSPINKFLGEIFGDDFNDSEAGLFLNKLF